MASPRRNPRLGRDNLDTLALMASPSMILVTPAKRHQRLLDLGYVSTDPTNNSGALAITPAGLRRVADELEAGAIEGAWLLAAKRRQQAN